MVQYSGGELNKNPNWQEICRTVESKYPSISDRIMLMSKANYFEFANDWARYTEAASQYISKYGDFMAPFELTRLAGTLFLGCNDLQCLEAAQRWIKNRLTGKNEKNLEYLTAYANLLYKTGKLEEAIKTQEEVVKVSGGTVGEYELEKMKKGEKTWF